MRENAHQRDGGHLSKWVLEIVTGLGLVLGDLGRSSWGQGFSLVGSLQEVGVIL